MQLRLVARTVVDSSMLERTITVRRRSADVRAICAVPPPERSASAEWKQQRSAWCTAGRPHQGDGGRRRATHDTRWWHTSLCFIDDVAVYYSAADDTTRHARPPARSSAASHFICGTSVKLASPWRIIELSTIWPWSSN